MNRNGGKKGAWRHSARVTAKASCGGAERAWDGGSVDGPRSHELEAGQRGAWERPRGFARRRRWNWLVVGAALCLALGGPESARGVDLVPGRSRVHGPRIHWMTLRGGGEAGKEESDKENDGGALSNLMEEAGEHDDDPEAEEMQKGRGLWFAADEGDEEELDEWVARGADVNSTTHTQLNAGAPLHWAAMKGRLGVMEKLLNLGADVNGRSKKDNQVCHTTCSCAAPAQATVRAFLTTTAMQKGLPRRSLPGNPSQPPPSPILASRLQPEISFLTSE
jgi:hypothetical protein